MYRSPFRFSAAAVAASLAVAAIPASANTFTLTYELPGVQNSSATFTKVGVETFDSHSAGANQTFASDFGGSGINGLYSGVDIRNADEYGGAGGNTTFASTESSTGYSVTFDQQLNYFGFWLSALDGGNVVSFYNGSTLEGSFNAGNILSAAVAGNAAYFGNPNAAFLGQNSGQAYAFINFYSTVGTFDKVVFAENPEIGGYESDNQTVGLYKSIGGIVTGVPEPGSWAMMGLGVAALFARCLASRKAVNS